ncbi:MAG: hypothetical protein J0H79_14020 [Alphaproteobacteria bacterium]|nr:hypothetical protein [Alphaproteobacteria bacterium]
MQQVAAVAGVACNNSSRIKPAEAARRLEINRSTLKRYLDRYPNLVDERGWVDFDELRQHRLDNPQIADAATAKAPKPAQSEDTAARRGNKHRLEEIRAWEAEREWAKSIGQLVDPMAMVDELAESAVAMRDRFMAPDPVLCERLAGESDPRVIMQLLRDANRVVLDDYAVAMKRIAGGTAADAGV